jgi:hypothetical protein
MVRSTVFSLLLIMIWFYRMNFGFRDRRKQAWWRSTSTAHDLEPFGFLLGLAAK